MNIRRTLVGLLIVCCVLTSMCSSALAELPDTSQMNVLFLDIEDCNADVWGCYGNTICQTPNVDRLSATGVRFDRAYCQAVCCNPSRSSFLTGLRLPTAGVWGNADKMDDHLPPGTVTLPELAKRAGFYTADVAKLFHRTEFAVQAMSSFDRLELTQRPGGWQGPEPILKFPPIPQHLRRGPPPTKDRNTKQYREWRRSHSDRYGVSGLSDEQEPDGRIARTATALIKEFAAADRRFFLCVGSSRPHTPLTCPQKYIDMYPPSEIPLPEARPTNDLKFPYRSRSTGGNPDIFSQQQATPKQTREAIAAYYGCVTFVDAGIGMILDELEEQGLADNTIVVFFADHGFHLGDHGMWSKYSLLEATKRVPLIVRVPGAGGNGQACQRIVELVDLIPTLNELVALNAPSNLEGISFATLLDAPGHSWKKAAFTDDNNDRARSVRTERYNYIEWKKPSPVAAALFDLKKDPWETTNLADDPQHAEVRKEMAELLKAGWKAALPQ